MNNKYNFINSGKLVKQPETSVQKFKKEHKKKSLTCQKCGRQDDTVTTTVDPFENEINNRQVIGVWCENCLDDMADDI